jgi:hypothetical protein
MPSRWPSERCSARPAARSWFQPGRKMKSSDATWRLVVSVCVVAMALAAVPATSRPDVSGATLAQAFSAEATHPALAQTTGPGRAQNLIGHWRNTRIIFDRPRDEHIVFRANGLVEKWSVTASRRSSIVRGRWESQANALSIDWEDGTQWSGPFTFHDGNLVFPNRQNQRRFWERIE